ncbi:hypothetical protein EB796_009577 [Bugula neritina]|uniref:ATPase dynein-related AAA domain-containing protein n=1 Tax=Bugula neritina TaxID=10212 RepID=A0A7J7K1J8_BUGNE|nr:hypothetical protein EB796_009577 [Bugula neritina]
MYLSVQCGYSEQFLLLSAVKRSYSLLDSTTEEVLIPDCISRELKMALEQHHLSLTENFNGLPRYYGVFILILYLYSHRVDIPVIIMGETGCGKTKLIEFMSKLQVPTALKEDIETMIIVKIHGGTTEEDIIRKVEEGQELALQNQQICQDYAASFKSERVPSVYTILFLDEANTTEAIGLVKEILCDGRMRGRPLDKTSGLKIIAACNPYRRHTPDMIEKLKRAGLGYNVSQEDTKDKFGQIPMRHLVYRVQALPQSLLPLVWDFGTLDSGPIRTVDEHRPGSSVELIYIQRMIVKFNSNGRKNGGLNFGFLTSRVAIVLNITQSFMRQQKDECSFVSLRDIQRVLEVSRWFYSQRDHLFAAMDDLHDKRATGLAMEVPDGGDLDEEELLAAQQEREDRLEKMKRNYAVRSMVLALGVCYFARLEENTRRRYAEAIREAIQEMMGIRWAAPDPARYVMDEIEICQDVFIDAVVDNSVHKNIAKNKALKENVFMMIVCIENRIPLFLVGKPGSSKSLSKAMVVDAMKGPSSKHDLFKRLKRSYMSAFQCSRHATPAGIAGVFKHCAKFQKGQDLDTFVSVVVLDEVGLAEDSENMPLKTLHPLLEDGCEDSSITPEPYMKCAFVGISNWALDPAKMNRGIFVQRGTPQDRELQDIAGEICRPSAAGSVIRPRLGVVQSDFISQLARGYLDICAAQKPLARDLTEFFGLRDFYSLMKMVISFATKAGPLNKNQLEHSIKRNFGGFDSNLFDPMTIFRQHCGASMERLPDSPDGKPPINSLGLIKSSLSGEDTALKGLESRYLLILTENLSVLSIIMDEFSTHNQQPEVVFGSKFRDDLSYTQICHNIYRIKTCMDMGKPVILLNLDDLYESLYDALNQYFSTWGDRKFVDLGLGTHRVKAFVDDNFRLVVIADKNKVHSQFPIPLINRLEKHYISATSLLNTQQHTVKERIENWATQFVTPQRRLQMNMCPFDCDGCGEPLDQPYKLPCLQHYVGPCCREKMFSEDMASECPVTSCRARVSPEFEWNIDKAALINRQYFEKSTTETAFIGYSSETTALTIRQATDEIKSRGRLETADSPPTQQSMLVDSELSDDEDMAVDGDVEEFWEQVFERAKFHLLQCATGESVLRLDKTMLEFEAKKIQSMYMTEQYHETLQQYLTHLMSAESDSSVYIQVTSFAELMVDEDEERLGHNLILSGHPTDIVRVFLKNYLKEDQFTEDIRRFYTTPSIKAKLLIVQCEAADENTELLDSVRYIIQRESSGASVNTFTVLLLSLHRGHKFTGYQGGKWKCIHIDDPRSPQILLPSLNSCLELTPSQIIQQLIDQSKGSEIDEANGSTLQFIMQCLPAAVSVINSGQIYDRVGTLRDLLGTNQQFVLVFLTHIQKLLEDQEQYVAHAGHWVKSDAAKASNMKQSETLRHALEDALERAFVPALAAVISFIDVRQNLLILSQSADFHSLWLQIFIECHKLGLNFEAIAGNSDSAQPQSKLPRSYQMRKAGEGQQGFTMQFPFSWIVKDTLDKFFSAVVESGRIPEVDTIIKQFRLTPIGKVVTNAIANRPNLTNIILEAYITDYVFMAHPCLNNYEHKAVGHSLRKEIHRRGYQNLSMVHIHKVYRDMKPIMSNLSAVVKLISLIDISLLPSLVTEIEKAEEASDLVAVDCLIKSLKDVKVYQITQEPEKWVDSVDVCKSAINQTLATTNSSPETVQRSRTSWVLLELKKLYVEHVIVPSPVDQNNKRSSHKLMFFLKKVTSPHFQTFAGFEQVVLSLQETIRDGIRKLYPKCPTKCPSCENSLDSPVRLPCNHILCSLCVAEQKLCGQENCGQPIPPNYVYDAAEDDISEESLLEFSQLRLRLNKFFMYFVSEMVFSSTPDEQVLQWLVNRVTFRQGTREFSVFNSSEVIDPKPVLRSFLLKLLLKCEQSDTVYQYLDQIINSWSGDNVTSQVQTMVLVMDCHKDVLERQHNIKELAGLLLDASCRFISRPVTAPTVDMLIGLAGLQSVLSQAVDYLTSQSECFTSTLKNLEDALKHFLLTALRINNLQPSYMIVRQLFHTAGESYMKDLINTRQNYLIAENIKSGLESFTIPDVLAVYGGETYRRLKAQIDLVITQSGDEQAIDHCVTDLGGRS